MIEFHNEIDRPGDHLIVAFAGIGQRLGGIPFEFNTSLGEADARVLFVRDADRRWYQYDTEVINHVVRQIRDTAAAVGATRLSCIGNSMGGFGALMFGALCAADAILAFVPQTTVLPQHMAAMGDYRWPEHRNKIEAYTYPDLNALSGTKGRVTVHYGVDDALDAAHANRLTWRSERIAHAGCKHNVAKVLRERGELVTAIRSALIDESR